MVDGLDPVEPGDNAVAKQHLQDLFEVALALRHCSAEIGATVAGVFRNSHGYTSPRSWASATIRSTTSAIAYPVVSTVTASPAGRNGESCRSLSA